MIEQSELIQGILLGVLLILIYTYFTRENYTSRREKAETIHGWWNNTPSPSYEKYKSDVKGSDVVEYSAVKKIRKSEGNNFSVDAVETVIS